MKALEHLLQGKHPLGMWRMYPGLAEYLMAKEFGWTLEYIRNINESDFEMLTSLLLVDYKIKGIKNKLFFERP